MEIASNPSQTRHSIAPIASRIAGRGRLLRSLRSLLRRVERFAAHRARSADEQRWACRLADGLEDVYDVALDAPAARLSLDAADRRASISSKGR